MKKKILCIGLPILFTLVLCCGIVCFLIGNRKNPIEKDEKDITAPVITIEGGKTLAMEVGEVLPLPAVSATDNVDGDVTDKIEKKLSHGTALAELDDDHFTTEVGGTYNVVYHVCDAAGNEALETLEIIVSPKTAEEKLEGSNDLSVLNQSGSMFCENFEKGPENELLYDNYADYYTLTGMENAISGNSLIVDYGKADTVNRVTLLSMMPYIQSGTWEISFDVKLVSGKGRDDFYIMYSPDIDKNVYYSERLLLADMNVGEVRHVKYEKVIEVLEKQKGTATFFLCNSNLECGDVVLMFDNFMIRRTDLEHTTYIPTVEELEAGFTYDWSDEKYATLGKLVEVNEIEDVSIRKALQGKKGFSDRVMLLTNDSVLNGILAANNSAFFQQGREYVIEINYYVASCQNSALLAGSSATAARGIRENLFTKRNEADCVTMRYLIGRGEEELNFYLFGYPSEIYIGDVTLRLADRTDKERKDYHVLTEKELYAGYTFDFSRNNLPKLSGNMIFIGHYGTDAIAADLPKGYFKSGETTWLNGMYELNLDFLDGVLKKNRTYDIRFRFYSDLPLEMDKLFILTRDKEGNATERNRFGINELGNGMYELHTQFMTDGTEVSALFYATQMISMYMDSITVSMQDTKPIVTLDDGIKATYKIDFDKEWLLFSVRNSNAGYVSRIPATEECGLYVKLREIVYFPQLQDFTKGRTYSITFTTKNTGKTGSPVGMFVNENKIPTEYYVTPTKTVSGNTVIYQFTFTADEKTKMFTLLNATPESEEEMYITDVEVRSELADTTSLGELTSERGYVSDFDNEVPALGKGQWTTKLPQKYDSVQEKFYYTNLNASAEYAMDFTVFDGLVKEGYYYTLSITGFLKNEGANILLLPMDAEGNYTEYKAVQATLADGQTRLTWYFNGGDYNTGRVCEYLRLYNASGSEANFEMYISELALHAIDYNSITGTFDKTANKIIFPNIYNVDDYSGNAEAVIIVNNGQVALIDSGEDQSEASKFLLLKKLKELGVTKLDVVIMSHPHSDHLGGFTMLAKHFDIGAFYCKDTCWSTYEINGYGAGMEQRFDLILSCMQRKVNSDGTKVAINADVDFGQKIAFGDGGEFIFYYAREVFGEDLAEGAERKKWDGNYFCLGTRYNTKDGYDAYFAGDSAIPTNEELLLTQFENCEIWQINHHGSSGPYTTMRMITLLDPKYAVVCGTKENLKEDVKSRIEDYGNIEICYPGDGEVEFDLNILKPEIEYKSLTEQELYAGHTFDLSKDNMPRVTSSRVEVSYMSGSGLDVTLPEGYFEKGTAIKAAGRYMVNLEFLNGLIRKGAAYDIKFRVYAPDGISRAVTYIEVTNEKETFHDYHRLGFTSLGDGMYELYAQVRCQDTESLFNLYSDTNQAFYIESVTVSAQDSKPYVKLDEGITQDYSIDFDEQWLDVGIQNTNAGYTASVPDVGGYGLYAKINETLYFRQLKGFTEGRTYQLTFTAHHTGNFGELLGLFYDSGLKQTSIAYKPVKTVSGDTVTYTFIFTADATTQMFGLYNNNRKVEEEMYIRSVDITSYMLDTVAAEEIHTTGYVSDFAGARLDFNLNSCRNHDWRKNGDVPVLHVKQVAGSVPGLRFKSFAGSFRAGTTYYLKIMGKEISRGNLLLLPMNASDRQISEATTYTVNRTYSEDTGETTYMITFTAPEGLYDLNLYCTGGTNEMEIRQVELRGISSDSLKAGITITPGETAFVYSGGKEVSIENGLLNLTIGDTVRSFNFDTFNGMMTVGKKYQLVIQVTQDSIPWREQVLLLPMSPAGKQLGAYKVDRAEGADGITYTFSFRAPENIYQLRFYYNHSRLMTTTIKSVTLQEVE